MARLLKSSFMWQFVGGFLIGAAGMAAMHVGEPAQTTPYSYQAPAR